MKLSDEEIICGWMEKRPPDGKGDKVEHAYEPRWWGCSYQVEPKPSGIGKEFHWQWHPITLTLDRLWEVEEKLPSELRLDYWLELTHGGPPELGYWRILHADTSTRISALTRILSR